MAEPIHRPAPTERSGTFKLAEIDGQIFSKTFSIPAPKGPLPTYSVTFTSRKPVECPSPWRHPLRWLRWNPYLEVVTKLHFPAAQVKFSDA